jgi:tRNA(Arg) A34 adenosine deaminase TadA
MPCQFSRRAIAQACLFGAALEALPQIASAQISRTNQDSEARWYEAALAMKRLAESWGDQAYGAVLVLNGQLVGEGPSRVVKNADPSAHAEREAIRDAQRRLRRSKIEGSILYATSRPCALCEAAAAQAGISRMYFGERMQDAGAPRH